MTPRQPRVGFVLEHTLGHITHGDNLRRLITADGPIEPAFASVEFPIEGWRARIPGAGNWTVRAGVRARRALRQLRRDGPLDALFVHSQVPAMLIQDQFRRQPTVVSLDATPEQFDALGATYGHSRGSSGIERAKWHLARRCFLRAAHVVVWSDWTKEGLVDGYDIPADHITVIPPGVDVERWGLDRVAHPDDPSLRVLFVGGDLERKGGSTLVEAVRSLRASGVAVSLDVVTRDHLVPSPGIRVHHGLQPNQPELIDLYQRADVFCLPTIADCLPMVLSEAGALGLPLVSTDIGAISEIVRPEETGLLVPPGDPVALATTLERLATDASLRRRLGEGAKRAVSVEYSAAQNAARLVDLLARLV